MASNKRWSEEDDAQLIAYHTEGDVSLREAGRRLGFSVETVVRHAKRLELDWSRAETEAAAEARRSDGRRKRAEIIDGLLDDIARFRDDLYRPTTVFNFGGRDNTYREETLPEPTHADKLKILQAITAAGQTIERFQRMDADNGVAEAVGMVDTIWEAIKAAAMTPEALKAADVEGADLL